MWSYWLVLLTSYSLQWIRLAFLSFSSALTFPTLSLHLSGTMVSARWHSQCTVSEGGRGRGRGGREGEEGGRERREGGRGGREGEEGEEGGREECTLHEHQFILALETAKFFGMQ